MQTSKDEDRQPGLSQVGQPTAQCENVFGGGTRFFLVARTDYQIAQKVGLSLREADKSASLHLILLDATFPQLLLPLSDFSSPSDKLL